MNAIVIYESIYGNTRAVAEATAEGLGDAPMMTPGQLPAGGRQPDLIVVGGPTHVHRMAAARSRSAAIDAARGGIVETDGSGPMVSDWLSSLPRARGARAAAFDTRIDKPEWLTGAASHGIAKRMRRHGYTVVDIASFLVTDSEGPLKHGELERARRWGSDMAPPCVRLTTGRVRSNRRCHHRVAVAPRLGIRENPVARSVARRDTVWRIEPAPDTPRTTIVLADDHAIVRSALRALLEAEAEFEIVAEAGDVHESVRKVLAYKPKVIVLDLSMPGGSSLTAIPRMREASPETAIVVLTMENEPRFAREALRAGALAFVLKDAADSELVAAVRAALQGQRYLNPQLGGLIASAPDIPPGPPDNLTEREVEVLRLVALGHTNAEIGQQLYLSVRTVESHRAHIQQKAGRSTRADLVAYAREHGLLDASTGQ